jgi:hypothetical protein
MEMVWRWGGRPRSGRFLRFENSEVQMKERFGHALAWIFILVYASLGAGCLWRDRGRGRDVYVERRHVEHDEHEHEHHEDKHDHDRH